MYSLQDLPLEIHKTALRVQIPYTTESMVEILHNHSIQEKSIIHIVLNSVVLHFRPSYSCCGATGASKDNLLGLNSEILQCTHAVGRTGFLVCDLFYPYCFHATHNNEHCTMLVARPWPNLLCFTHFAFLFCSNFLPILLPIVPNLLFITPILLLIKSHVAHEWWLHKIWYNDNFSEFNI